MMRQSSLFPMRTDRHFFLAEPLSQFPLMARADVAGAPTDVAIGVRSDIPRKCGHVRFLTQLRHERLIFAATRDAVLAGRLC
jgi:hypothetical protein